MLERVVGKIRHCHTFRPCLRSSFGEMRRCLLRARVQRESRCSLSDICFEELLEATLLLPLAVLELRAPFCPRVVTTDASGNCGHGLAYAKVEAEMVQK